MSGGVDENRYFIWDTIDSLLNSTIGFVVHGKLTMAREIGSIKAD